jgi:hypothetical protein
MGAFLMYIRDYLMRVRFNKLEADKLKLFRFPTLVKPPWKQNPFAASTL